MMHGEPRVRRLSPIAQTSVQLFEQLRESPYSAAERGQIRAAYQCAVQLFAGHVCGSGKAYVAHSVGVASALAALGAPADVVAAGTVHAAYEHGEFGWWRVSRSLKRARLRRALGARVEQHVFHFQFLAWNPDAVTALPGRFATLDADDRAALLMRLADELDHLRSAGILYRVDAERHRAEAIHKAPALIDLAGQLGVPALADALAAAIEEVRRRTVSPLLRSQLALVVAPESAVVRLEGLVARRIAASLRRRRRAAGPRHSI
jgi:(p)ppGpp synthase/HD superfamily hydrolase